MYHKAENKHASKVHAELFGHVVLFENALRSVMTSIRAFFKDPDRLCNVEKYAVCADTGKALKVFSGVDSHHGLTLS